MTVLIYAMGTALAKAAWVDLHRSKKLAFKTWDCGVGGNAMPTHDMPGMSPEIRAFYEQITKLAGGGSPEATRERYAALDAFELIGEVYYYRWLGNGEILPQALENCLDAKAHFETAQRLESQCKNKEE